MVSSYEARQEELLQENKGLSAALADLQSDYRALANKQAAAQQVQAAAVRQVVEEEDLQHVLRSSDAGQVQADLSAKMAAMKTKIEGVYDGPMQQVCPHLLVHMQMTCRNTLMASAAVCYWCRLMPESSSYIQYMLQDTTCVCHNRFRTSNCAHAWRLPNGRRCAELYPNAICHAGSNF